ncbi:50S ribosomal protein L33 [Alkalicoccus urumqiensis]|uniref:Large ribosomal subunit protein bL33 n=1 Tax=Alkalicoccus urumqiensis TaxID=1548213 RepID=A0A2P6MEB2_ALKUR|nr:50S ribosomal protein L33 [Alkalicoccus urumqiensis]PRO64624.1 50S ribosomal protein L33 [Alkalicoccus urumqiensis]
MQKTTLACTICLTRNYTTTKSANDQHKRLQIKKYCTTCGKHTLHAETR